MTWYLSQRHLYVRIFFEEICSQITSISTRFEVVTAMTMKITVFWGVTPCNLVERYRRFGGTCRFHIPPRRMDTRNSDFIQVSLSFSVRDELRQRLRITVYWSVAPSNLVERYQRFGGTCSFNIPPWRTLVTVILYKPLFLCGQKTGWKLLCIGVWNRVIWWNFTDVSEEPAASLFHPEEWTLVAVILCKSLSLSLREELRLKFRISVCWDVTPCSMV
jgi:hypothetical protein